MIRKAIPGLVFTLALLLTGAALAQDKGEGPLDKSQPVGITPEQIIQKFAAKEKEFAQARENYTWRQTVIVDTLDGDTVDGEFKQVYDVLFDTNGRRTQQVVFAPQDTLQRVVMSPSDYQDIENRLPFVMTTDDLAQYNVLYVGKQQEDELGTYVFDVAPKSMEKNKRYFQGRIWVDDRDFQIVKTHGLNVPQVHKKNNEDLSPPFTTWRQQVDGKYWFPVYTIADDTLHFQNNDVRIREKVKYENYKRFGSNVKITYEGQEVKNEGQQQSKQQQPPQPPPKK